MSNTFEKHNVVIFGAGETIGRELARDLVWHGARLALIDRDVTSFRQLARELGAIALQGDPSRLADVRRALESVRQRLGSVHGVVSLIGSTVNPERDGEEQNGRVIGPSLNVTRGAYTQMRNDGGAIVLLSTDVGEEVPADGAETGARDMESLTRAVATSYAPFGIRVNCVAPSADARPVFTRWRTLRAGREYHDRRDIIAAIRLFLDPDNDWLSGQTLRLGGRERLRAR
jgi:NAD(P)-dependent dehydrogenase (short-subunit alcohol dehydrogenase family)